MIWPLFNGSFEPQEHIRSYIHQWDVDSVPSQHSLNLFIHSLGTIPRAWYLHEELQHHTPYWQFLQAQFYHDFSFQGKSLEVIVALQIIKDIFFLFKIIVQDLFFYLSLP